LHDFRYLPWVSGVPVDTVGDTVVLLLQTGQLLTGCGTTVQLDVWVSVWQETAIKEELNVYYEATSL